MKKFIILYITDILWIAVFLILALYVNANPATGLAALNSAGWFIIFGICFLIGIVALLITVIINALWLLRKRPPVNRT
jgi:hypothetical protein